MRLRRNALQMWRRRLHAACAPRYDSNVARKTATRQRQAESQGRQTQWPATATAALFLLVQLVFLPGAASAFRLPKEALLVAGTLVVLALGVPALLRANQLQLRRGALTWVLAALPLLQACSAAWAADPRRALAAAAVSAAIVAAALWLAALDGGRRERIAVWTAVGTAISSAVLLLQAAGVPILVVGVNEGSRFRMSGLAGNPADLATGAILILPLLLLGSSGTRSPRRWLLIGILLLAAVVSQTFTGYVALAAVAVVWLARQRSPRLWAITAVIAAVAAALAVGAGLGERVRRQVWRVQHGDWYSLMSARSDGWTAAAEMIRRHPVLGVGAGHFDHDYYPSRLAWLEEHEEIGRRGELATHFEWAHCDPLQLVAELGAFGGLWMVALAWALVRTRPRGDPLLLLAAAATTPFLMLHYPTHLAVGMVPIALVLGHLLAAQPAVETGSVSSGLRAGIAVILVLLAVAGAAWQLRRVALDIWRADLERRVAFAYSIHDPARRVPLAAAVEREVVDRIGRLPGAAPWLWRIVGKARLTRDDPAGAAEAFRTAFALWPHEEAELGLGLALAAEGRRNEALVPLGRVTRVNPALVRHIEDPNLRRAVIELNRARRR